MRPLMLMVALAAAVALYGCQGKGGAGTEEPTGSGSETAVERVPLSIHAATGVHKFRVEMARTEVEQQRGLMYRTSLPADGGMLFPSAQPEPRSFWMKNTVMSLDMIFIRQDGSIARIAEETVPESLDQVESGEPVIAVLEIAGGRAAALGIAEGDQVSWPDGPAAK
ncbi:DUF192 domain-containing protein [Sphingomonas colocasiae]